MLTVHTIQQGHNIMLQIRPHKSFYGFLYILKLFSQHSVISQTPHDLPFQRDLDCWSFTVYCFDPRGLAWRASQHSGWVNVSYTRLLMRPETKERADTIIGSVLREAHLHSTRRQLEIWGERGGSRERGRERAGETKRNRVSFRFANNSPEKKWSHWLSWTSEGGAWRHFFLVEAAQINILC